MTLWSKTPTLLLALSLLLAGFSIGCGDAGEDSDADGESTEGTASDLDTTTDEADADGEDGEDGELELPEVDCDGADVPAYADVDAFSQCVNCHSSDLEGGDRNGALDDVNFDTHGEAVEHAELGAHEVFEGAMPPADSGFSLTDDEKDALYLWALCGTPE